MIFKFTGKFIGAALCLAASLFANAASADAAADDFGKCLVDSTSADDRAMLAQMMFATMALNPSVRPLSAISDDQRDELAQKTADLIQKLEFTDCRAQAVAALKANGPTALRAAFTRLNAAAAGELLGDPAVRTGVQAYNAYVAKDKMADLFKEAGLPPPGGPASAPKPAR
jgi:hypothetical protein